MATSGFFVRPSKHAPAPVEGRRTSVPTSTRRSPPKGSAQHSKTPPRPVGGWGVGAFDFSRSRLAQRSQDVRAPVGLFGAGGILEPDTGHPAPGHDVPLRKVQDLSPAAAVMVAETEPAGEGASAASRGAAGWMTRRVCRGRGGGRSAPRVVSMAAGVRRCRGRVGCSVARRYGRLVVRRRLRGWRRRTRAVPRRPARWWDRRGQAEGAIGRRAQLLGGLINEYHNAP
jgi:hypothetical protein